MKKAEQSDEVVLRMVELDGSPRYSSGCEDVGSAAEREHCILAASVINVDPSVTRAQPVYDVLPSTNAATEFHLLDLFTRPVNSARAQCEDADLVPSQFIFPPIAFFEIGPPNAPDMVTGKTVSLLEGKFTSVNLLALGVNGSQELQKFTVIYSDGSTSTYSQKLSDWALPSNFPNESAAVNMPYRLTADGSKDTRTFYADAYSFNLDPAKQARSITLPSNRDVLVLAISLLPADAPSKQLSSI